MGEGDNKELRELVEFLKANSVAEFDMERPELKVRLKFAGASETQAPAQVDLAALARLLGANAAAAVPSAVAPAGVAPVAAGSPAAAPVASAGESAAEADEDAGLHIVKSPLVGTFYEASAPGADPFVKVGDSVSSGSVLCIVEAMKIMNEIESDASGTVAKVYVKAGQPVEYGQRLFGIKA